MLIPALIIIGCGVMCLLIPLFTVLTIVQYKRSGVRTTGRIIATKPAIHDSSLLNPIVTFTTASGENIEFKSVEICKPGDVGQSVEIYYLPKKPNNAEFAKHGEWSMLKDAAKTLGFGLACIIVGIGLLASRYFLKHLVY